MIDLHLKHWPPGMPLGIVRPPQSIAQNLMDSAARNPGKTALIYYGATYTYGALMDSVNRMAGWLQAQGVQHGDRVLLYMQNAPQSVIAYYAILRADAVVIPVNPMNRQAELEHLARDTDARIALIGSELVDYIQPLIDTGDLDHLVATAYADMAAPDGRHELPPDLAAQTEADIDATRPGVVLWSKALAANHSPAPHRAGPDDLAVIPYSSGTTGNPKGCMHPHRTVQATIQAYKHWTGFDETVSVLSVLPYFHVTGMQSAMNAPLACGSTVVIMTRWNRDLAARIIQRHKVTMWRSITTMVIDLLNAPDFDTYDLSSLTMISAGGAAMPKAIAAQLKAKTGLEVLEGYGLSESMAATHMNPVSDARPQCLGIPLFDIDSRVVDPATNAQLGPNEPGEIVMRGPQIFTGYWRNDAATKDAFIDIDGHSFFRTGDIGSYDEDGFWYMTDRVKRMINASGFKVWPAEVEALMLNHPDIAQACVIGIPDPRRGEKPVAYVVKTRDAKPQTTAHSIIAWCHDNMAAYKCPGDIAFVDALPKTGSGKVMWRDLMNQHFEPSKPEATQITGS